MRYILETATLCQQHIIQALQAIDAGENLISKEYHYTAIWQLNKARVHSHEAMMAADEAIRAIILEITNPPKMPAKKEQVSE